MLLYGYWMFALWLFILRAAEEAAAGKAGGCGGGGDGWRRGGDGVDVFGDVFLGDGGGGWVWILLK